MPDEKYTRCPGCETVFRVTTEQLAARSGQVRCGHCKSVFDGLARQVTRAHPPAPDDDLAHVAYAAAAATPEPVQDSRPPDASSEAPPPASGASAGDAVGSVPYVERLSPEDRERTRRAAAWFHATAIGILVLLIAAQAGFHFRDAIAARWPGTRAPLSRLCDTVGCAISPLRDVAMNFLSIEASDLQADPAHRGLLILTATLRSRAGWPLAYPHLELTLTDAQDRVVVRRALSPGEYAGGTANLQQGIAANGEVAVKVFIDASASSQAGYRLYIFYP